MGDAHLRLRSIGSDEEEEANAKGRAPGGGDGMTASMAHEDGGAEEEDEDGDGGEEEEGDEEEQEEGDGEEQEAAMALPSDADREKRSKKKWRRPVSMEEMAFVLAQEEARASDLASESTPYSPEFAEIMNSDEGSVRHRASAVHGGHAPAAANTTGGDTVNQSAIIETAFGLPHVDLDEPQTMTRKSSLQMIATAAREFRDAHRASTVDVTDPEAMTLAATRRAWWSDVRRTVGYTLLFADAMYVLTSAPLRLGFFFDPWDQPHSKEHWTHALTIFSVLDVLGELTRLVFIWRISSRRSKSSTMVPRARSDSAVADGGRRRRSTFLHPSRKSLFSTRGSVTSSGPAIKASEVLSTVTRPKDTEAERQSDLPLAVLMLGAIPIELIIASINYNWLHVVRSGKLLAVGLSLAPAYSTLLLKCRRFRWAQWLSFSTLALPFYLFWLGLYLCHISACGYMLIANVECGVQSQYCTKAPIPGSWVLKDNMEQATLWRRYVRSMYWASKTVTTLGQGDLVPATLAETNYCVVVQFISGLWATSFLASCSFYFSRRDRDIENGVSTRLEQALRFLKSRRVPSTLALQIRHYYQHVQRTRNGIEEDQVLANLPVHYRAQCRFFVKYRLLAKIPFFAKQPKAFLRSVVDHVQNDFLSPKHTILALFEPVELIIVAKGDMSVLDQSKVCFRVVTQGEWFGEEVLFEDSRSKFELEAKTFCEILRLSRQHFQACMEKHFPRLKIAALMAQQKRRLAMIPSTDIRLQDVSGSVGTQVRGRTSGRSTLFVILQQALRGASEDDSGLVWYYPESRFRKKWRRWKAFLLLFVALEVPFTVAFEWRTGFFDKSASMQQWFLDVLVIVIEVFFYVDWAFRACVFARPGTSGVATKEDSSTREELVVTATAAAKAKDGVVTMPRDLWQLYLVRGSLAFDMAVNLPIAMTWNLVNSPRYSILVREVMRCARLLTFGRLVVLKRTLKKILVERDFSPASQLLANIVIFCVIAANGMACYFYLLADDKDFYEALPVGFDPGQTPVGFNECLEMATLHSNCTWFMYDRSKFSIKARYIRALHWSLVLLSTVGYGDILSFSNSECLLGFWWIFLGALICYFTSCAVSSVVSQLTVLRAAQDARVEAITRALVRTNVSSAMRIMIRSHYEANWEMNGSAFPEQKMMAHLPRSLRHQLSASLYVQSIRRCYVFSCLGGQAAMLREIALLMSSEMFLPRVTIVENGHLASALYIILSGDVELLLPYDASHRTSSTMRRRSVLDTHSQLPISVYGFYLRLVYYCFRHNQRRSSLASSAHPQAPPKHQQALGIPISALREGDCFGEEGLLDQRSALRVSARTLTGTQLAVLTRDSFMSLAGRFPVQVRQIVTLIAKKQDADMALFDTIRGNFLSRHKSLEFLGMSPSLYCVETPHVSNIISSEESRYKVWHVVHALVVIYNFYMITFRLAFLTRPSTTTRLMLMVLDYFTDAFLYADIYLKWNRFGYEEYGDQIVDLVAIRRRYKKGWLRVDCWSMLPLYYYGDFFSMSLARLPRLLKSLQLIENIDTLESLMREKLMRGSSAMLSVFDLSKFLVFFLSAAHQIGSVYFLLGRLLTEYELAASSWITVDAVLNVYPGDVMVQYNRAIYWCLETFTVVCFGDVIAQNAGETVYAFCTCIVGWMCIGQVVGRITSLMANIDKDRTDHNARVDNFEKYARDNDLPHFLRERAIESAEYKSKCLVELNLRSTFEDLPPALHAMLFEEMYGACVRRVPEFTQAMKSAQLRVLADALTFRIYVTDDMIFEEGRLGSNLFIMKKGRAELFSAKSMIVFAAVHEGQLFGDTAFFIPDARYLWSARASRSCQVLELARRTWNEIWDDKSRRALEEKLAATVQHKRTSMKLAYANIARNFDMGASDGNAADDEGVQGPLRAPPLDAFDELGSEGTTNSSPSQLTQYRSSLQGYTTLLSAIKRVVWLRVSRKVAPVLGYVPVSRRSSCRRTVIGGQASAQKLRRSLGVSTTCSMKHVSRSGGQTATLIEPYNTSAYAQHLETIKSRFRRRQEHTVFNLHHLTTTALNNLTTFGTDPGGTTSEIWVDPPPPASFCLENSKFRRVWNTVMYMICLYFVLIVPFRVSFDYEFLANEDNQAQVCAWFIIEYVMDAICMVDFVLNKNYFTFVSHGTLVTEPQAIRDHYLHEGTYLMDLFAIIPFEILLPLAPLSNAPGTNVKVTWYRVGVFRLNKMVRIAHLHELGEKFQRMLVYDVKVASVRPSLIYFARFAFDFALGAHWVACMFYGATFNGFNDAYPSWLTAPGMLTFEGRASEHDVGKVPVEMKYARSYHFSMGAITTVSYGDIAPLNAWETLVGTFVIIISMVLFGMLSGGFCQMFEMELGQRADYEEKIASVAHFMMFHQFPTRIWRHMQSYFMVHWSESQGMNEDELLLGLPLSVKNDITLFVKQDFVKQMRLFAGCDEAFVRAVVAAFDQELFVRNDVIITYGDRGRSLYVIESGSVLVRIPQSLVVASQPATTATTTERQSVSVAADVEIVKGRFDFFGEKSLVFDIPRSATCVALSSCSMLILTVEKYDAIIEAFPEYREKNMRDWIFAYPTDARKRKAMQTLRRLSVSSNRHGRRASVMAAAMAMAANGQKT